MSFSWCRSTKDPGQKPFEYQAGVGKVITGWDQGCLGMKLGEVRQLTIPADEGYGANGFPAWGIPPNGGLYFGARAPLGHLTLTLTLTLRAPHRNPNPNPTAHAALAK